VILKRMPTNLESKADRWAVVQDPMDPKFDFEKYFEALAKQSP
jgi:hypothetical protein